MNSGTDIYLQLLRKFEVETREKVQEDENSAKQLSLLTNAFWRPLAILRSFGNNPFSFRKIQYGSTGIEYRRFDYRRFSGLTITAFFLQLVYITGFAFLAYRLHHGHYQASSVPGSGIKAKHTSKYADGLMRVFISAFFLASGSGAVCSFCTTAKLSKFLNYWADFSFNFSKTFYGRYVNWKYVQIASNFLGVYTVTLCSFYIYWSLTIYKTCIFDIYNNCTWIEREQSFMMAGFGCSSILNTTFEYYKLGLMLNTTSHAFSQMKDAIKTSKSSIGSETINLKDLFNLIYGLRDQNKLLMNIFGVSLLFILFFLFALTIISWMMIMQFSSGDIAISLVLVVASIGFIQFSRFLGLAVLSERIKYREKQVRDEISAIKYKTVKARVEVQMFVNLLTKNPSEFTLSNIITMRRSIFLALMSNSTTYLIAVLQLSNVSSISSLNDNNITGISSLDNSTQ